MYSNKNKCVWKIIDNSTFCNDFGARIIKTENSRSSIALAIITIAVVLTGWCGNALGNDHNENNPVLNSPDDITDELISKIIHNDIDSLTINYEFTRCQNDSEKTDDWVKYRLKNNPFWIANQRNALTNINFKIILTPDVHSLACAFSDMRELESVNLPDTSMVTDMSGMFSWAVSFNQPIGN